VHLGITTGIGIQEDAEKFDELIGIENAWYKHILMSRINAE
jgi:hypothetical protein